MGVAEVYVNPTLYYLAYSQSPLRLRSSAQALGLLMSATSSALFTVLTAIIGSGDSGLQQGYYMSLSMMIPFLCAAPALATLLEPCWLDCLVGCPA